MGPVNTLPVYMGDVPDYEVRNGQMHVIVGNSFEIVMPLAVFLMGSAKAHAAVAHWERRHQEPCQVLPFRQEFVERA